MFDFRIVQIDELKGNLVLNKTVKEKLLLDNDTDGDQLMNAIPGLNH